MSDNLAELINWFPSGTAEGEKAILERVFVYADEFAAVMAPPPGNPHLLIGTKGSGKSAIFDFGLRVLKQQDVPAVLITPMDIETSNLTENSSTGDMVRIFSQVIMAAIANKLSESSTGWLDSDRATLYRQAVAAGNRSPDFVGRMCGAVAALAKPLVKMDFAAAFPHLTNVTRQELAKAVGRVVSKKSFYVFIDDTDQIANPEKSGHLNRIWALMLAIRKISSDVPELKAVISLRTEVWQRLKTDPAGQRDQTDHFNSLCITLKTDRAHVEKIIDRRLALAATEINCPGQLYEPFFEGSEACAPYSLDRRLWRDLIVVRSRQRPRDAIQLINELAKKSIINEKTKIDEGQFKSVIPIFSERISREFAKEVSLECPAALEILKTFSRIYFNDGAFTMNSDAALQHFKMVLTKFSVSLFGITLSQTVERDAFELWRFFYAASVLNARVTDASQKDGYKHLDAEQDPTLISKVRWNELQKILWEINTVYRDYLMSVAQEEKLNTGLAVKTPRGKRRPR